jgi:hypothetical protein
MSKLSEEFAVLATVALVDERKRVQMKSPTYYQSRIDKLPVGTELHITFSKKVLTRSQSMLSYFFVLVHYISEYTGESVKRMYVVLIEEVWEPEEFLYKGKMWRERKSISDVAKMSKEEMSMLIDHTLATCEELEISVPTKEELGFISN